MATALDFDSERRATERSLRCARRERGRDYLRREQGEEHAAAQYELSCAKVKRLEEDLEAIAGAAELDREDRAQAAKAERERQRQAAKSEYGETLGRASTRAEQIDAVLSESLAPLIDALKQELEGARRLRVEFVDEDDESRRLDTYQQIARELSLRPIEDWLEQAAARLGLVVNKTHAQLTDEPLADVVRSIADRALKGARHQFGEEQ